MTPKPAGFRELGMQIPLRAYWLGLKRLRTQTSYEYIYIFIYFLYIYLSKWSKGFHDMGELTFRLSHRVTLTVRNLCGADPPYLCIFKC